MLVKKILLADDSITIQKVVELTFSEDDYQVACVSNGVQALKKIAEWRPNVVLLDVIMPEKNGYEVCEEMKRHPSTSSIPVLLLTGTFEPFDQKRAEAAGARGHLTKPFESQALVSKVEELLSTVPEIPPEDPSGMDVVSGGRLYHVDTPSVEAPSTLSQAAPGVGQGQGDPQQAASPLHYGAEAELTSPPTAPLDILDGDSLIAEDEPEDASHPALQAPDPGSGGSYVDFADLDVDAGDAPEIIPDRFDEQAEPGSTMRVNREALTGSVGSPPTPESEPTGPEPMANVSEEPIEGLTGAFEIQEPQPQLPEQDVLATPIEEVATEIPAPEEAVNDLPRHVEEPPLATSPPREADVGGNGPLSLTPEAIDLIAERVVQRISDRVVREIAWEVVPHTAEAVVRQRIKELEEKEGS
jgi:CheY-like chemotaxis protein